MASQHDSHDPRIDWVRLLAHDLRAPLTALTASIGFLEQRHADPESAYLLSAARDAVLRLNRIIDNVEVRGQLLERAQPAEEPVELGQLLRGCAAQLQGSLALRESRLELSIATEPLWVRSDLEVLRIAFANALLNAVESSPLGGVIRAELGREGDATVLRVHDQGPSIPPEAAEGALDDLGQLELRRKAIRIGRGLTLVAARLASEALGGTARLEPEGTRGCRLALSLPLAAVSALPAAD